MREQAPPGRLAELVRLFAKLGFTAFGGPAAHIAMMHDEVVTRRRWLDEQRFLDLIGVTNLIPGPNSTEMAMHVGHERAGWRGLVAAGASFILPAAAIVLAFAWAYTTYGATPTGEALLYGVKPVVVVVVAQALLRLGRSAVKGPATAMVAGGAVAAYLWGVDELVILAVGAAAALTGRRLAGGGLLGLPAGLGVLGWASLEVPQLDLGRLFLVFLKVGALLYGSGYVLLAFLERDLVLRLQVLTEQQLLDAVAIGQFTPGPLFTTATFVGYLLGGLPGAVVATVGIFLPAFLFVGAATPLARRVREREWAAALLDGVNAAALGLMAAVTVVLADDALTDPLAVGVAAAAGVALWRWGVNSAWVMLGGAAVGLLAGLAGHIS